MQTTSTLYDNYASSDVKPLSWQLRISWDKAFDDAVTFFTLDTSLLDGVDVLAPSDGEVVQEWDKYEYADYTDRVMSVEITREEVEPYSVVQAFADVTLDNTDDYFTPNSGSPIDQYILPKRPTRILLGFGGQNLPQFIGLTERMPEIEKTSRTAKIHMIDFMSYLFAKKIDNTELLTDVSTGEALTYLFESVGLLASQLDFTSTSFNRIPFFFIEKGQTLGAVVNSLMEAEQGRLFMNELGIITFLNRQDYSTTPVMTINEDNAIDYRVSGEDDVINFVRLESEILEEQQEQSIWQSSDQPLVKAGGTTTVWASLQDPVTDVTTPTYSADKIGASYFTGSSTPDGLNPTTDITLSSINVFSSSVKLVFANGGSNDAYVSAIDLWGTPIKVVDTILVEDTDQDSIDAFDERLYELKTRYIQKRSDAISKAAILLDDYKDFASILEIDLGSFGTMALQIGDVVSVSLDGYNGDYIITKIEQIMQGGGYIQRLTVKEREVRSYFILDVSELDGTDVLAP